MSYIFGIDGGGTGCRVGLADKQGNIIHRQNGGPANIETAFEEAEHNIMSTCENALSQMNIPQHVIKDTYAILGLAGSNMGDFANKLSERLPFKENLIINDGEITLQGALGPSDGCIATIGTGSVYIGRTNGIVKQIGGWGFTLGDDGSGAKLGQTLLRLAVRCQEDLDVHSELTRKVMKGFDNEIINLIKETKNFKPKDFAQFAHLVFEFHSKGDPHALNILNNQIPIIEKSLLAVGFDEKKPFCLVGGLGKFYKNLIHKEFLEALIEPEHDAVGGAIAIALSHYGHKLM